MPFFIILFSAIALFTLSIYMKNYLKGVNTKHEMVFYAAHGDRAIRNIDILEPTIFIQNWLLDDKDNAIHVAKKFRVFVQGPSVEHIKIDKGSYLLCDILTEVQKSVLKKGDVVIINTETDRSNCKYRIRIVDYIQDGIVSFQLNSVSEKRDDRNLSEIYAIATHHYNPETEKLRCLTQA
jgi:hypothetical protein